MRRAIPAAACGALFLAALPLTGCTTKAMVGNEDSVQGTVQVCASCHGPHGRNGNPTFPVLAAQQPEYLEAQLRAFRDHTRADPHAHTYMWGMAAKLSDATIKGVAQYYAGQTAMAPGAQDPALVNAGTALFANGLDSAGIPACAACHGADAHGNGAVPRLAGQHRAYLQTQLLAFQENARANDTMHGVAASLSPQQMRDVAAYLATLK